MSYNFALEVCDVADRVQLIEYREKRTAWLQMVEGDPKHAVWQQIHAMLWSDAIFRMVNETRRLSHQAASSSQNPLIAEFIDHGFVVTQSLAIRKLMERAHRDPKKQIVSLRRVFDDIFTNRHLITRENYVAHDGLPYDTRPGERDYMAKVLRENQGDVHSEWVSTTGPQAWGMAAFAHEQFDKLSGVSADHRARSDLIRDDVFHTIEHMLVESGWKDIVNLGNKFIAHSADAYSRGLLPDRQTGFSLDQLSRCHRAICRAAATISGPILWEGVRGLLPTPQFDPFEHLDAPWISPKDMAKLSDAWDVHAEKVEEWTKGNLLE